MSLKQCNRNIFLSAIYLDVEVEVWRTFEYGLHSIGEEVLRMSGGNMQLTEQQIIIKLKIGLSWNRGFCCHRSIRG